VDAEQWRRVSALLHEAVARPPVERAAFLDQACANHPDDRREVESLLRHHEGDASFLEDGLGRVAAELMSPTGRPLHEGDQVGPYRVEREIARGGMGVIYLARDLRLDRAVAIKALPAELGHDARQRARLRQEARAAAAVSHPGIAHVYSLEEGEDGTQYLVSEYVEGRTIREEIGTGRLSPSLLVDTALQICRAVAAAHARGIVHRDLKPENVMRSGDGTVKVLDFGLAHSALVPVEPGARLTAPGAVVGTPAYMSPEQLRGGDVGVGTDVFALGLLIHEMATGRHPFGAGHSISGIVRILESEPDPLPADVTMAVPGLDQVVRRALQKSPADRFASMADMAAALQQIDSGAPAATAGPRQASEVDASDTRRSAAPSVAAWWWQVHHMVIGGLYILSIYPAWLARGGPVPAWVHDVLLLGLVAAAALAATLRLHQVFTARVHPSQLWAARRRAAAWIRRADWLVAGLLLALSGVALARDRLWLSALLLALSACSTVAFLAIEPATAEAAFPGSERV
jgi:serine/threonine protein kinase